MKLAVLLLLLFPSPAMAQQAKITALPKNADALDLALAEMERIPPPDRPYQRFIWVADADLELAQAMSHAVNLCSRTGLIRQPVALGKGPLLLLRIDARWYASPRDLPKWLETWEELRFDPSFTLLLTKDALRLVEGGEWVRPYVDNGKIIAQPVTAKDIADTAVLRVQPPDIDAAKQLALMQACVSTAPIVEAHYLTRRLLTSIRDKDLNGGLYDFIWGGLYPRFVGLPDTLDQLFEDVGIGNVKAKITKDNLFDRFRSDRRVAMFASDITDGPRSVEMLPILAASVYDSERAFAITSDIKRSNRDRGVNPMYNLFRTLRDPDAHESIWDSPNGLHRYALHNGAGKLQEKVPDDIAHSDIRTPHPAELQYPLDCMACHEKDGSEGWKRMQNDVATLLGPARPRLDIPFDLNFKDQADAVDRIGTLFAGDSEKLFKRGRPLFAQAVLQATGPWKSTKKANADVIQLSSGKLVDTAYNYAQRRIGAREALRECGWDVADKEASAVFARLVPPLRAAGDFVLEDPTVAFIARGGRVLRYDFDLVKSAIRGRIAETLKAEPDLLKKVEAQK